MIGEIIVWGFFSALGWWGAQKLVLEKIDPPKESTMCVQHKENICGVKDK